MLLGLFQHFIMGRRLKLIVVRLNIVPPHGIILEAIPHQNALSPEIRIRAKPASARANASGRCDCPCAGGSPPDHVSAPWNKGDKQPPGTPAVFSLPLPQPL